MAAVWTEEKFDEMKNQYLARMDEYPEDDRPSMSTEVVAELAGEHGFSVNAFRMKLSSAGVYIKKNGNAPASKDGESKTTGGARTSKATAHAELKAALTDGGVAEADIDMSILEKLTGKAAVHFAELIRKVTK